ncbi:nucleotidyltransferase family protein [Candidatus Aquicultor secundus]|uniref:DNA polymerase subunit beta n=1 Tax=Candidatus Aquicultor secundus TaxID=1973895 RepID=A0A2M7T7T9_9ACTN|nr:nucleotidyltransferase family protein [Candidatus Aquicultor secundus]PIZ38637.1 MAG: DNA polymerase subunit beta [Candidatus Aquicultor secundus]
MRRDEAFAILKSHKQELIKFDVKSLAIFGSVARDEAGPESDVDILVEFSKTPSFDGYMELKFFLEDLLGRSVDLVTRDALKPRIRPYVEKELLYVA